MQLRNGWLDRLLKSVWIVTIGGLMTVDVSVIWAEGAPTERDGYWLACTGESVAGAPPNAGVFSSSLDSTVITLTVPGVSMSARSAGGDVYSVAEIPREGWIRAAGKPMVPRITLLVACPEFDDLRLQCQLGSQTVVEDLLLCPSPREMLIEDGSTFGPTEVFSIDENAYASDTIYPAAVAEILSIGRIRDQKVVWLGICPVQYNAAQRKMVAAGQVTITLSYANSKPSLAVRGTGPFEDICRRLLVGYEGAGAAGPMSLLSAGGGQVIWATNLQDCIGNNTDYLMVAADRFCSGADSVVLQRLADFRADSCGFNVSIMNVMDIGATDTTLKSFIKDLYDSRSAAHWWDGHLGFVALVGDFKDPAGDTLITRHLVPSEWGPDFPQWPDSCASDNWYACVTEDSLHPAVMLGRMSVDNGAELANVVDKILGYEPIPDGPGWSKRLFLTAGTPRADSAGFARDTLYVSRAFQQIESTAEADGFEVSILRGDKLGPSFPDLTAMNADSLEPGRYFVNYLIHADPFTMGYQPNQPKSFTACSVDTLANYGNLCVFTSFGCQTARFDTDSMCVQCSTTTKYDCVGERFLNTDDIGAVAYIGQTDMGDYGQINNMDVDFYEAVFKRHDPVLGMALVETLLRQNYPDWINRIALLGDPALRIRYRESTREKWDLWVRPDSESIWFEPPIDVVPTPGTAKLKARLKNMTSTALNIPTSQEPVRIKFWINTTGDSLALLGTDSVRTMGAWGAAVVEVAFNPATYSLGEHDFVIEIDPDSLFEGQEAHRDNNVAVVSAYIGLPPSVGRLPSVPSDHPVLAYLEPLPGAWEHRVLFPCENSWIYTVDGSGKRTSGEFNADDGPLHCPAVADMLGDGGVVEVVTSQHKVWCIDIFEPDSLRVKWMCDLGDTVVMTPPCLADVDGDGELEAALGVMDPDDSSGCVIRVDGGSIVQPMTSLGDSVPSVL